MNLEQFSFFISVVMQLSNEGDIKHSSNCFGYVIKANCSSSYNIHPINVMVGAKPSSINCTSTPTACCSSAIGDCTGKYTDAVDLVSTAGVFYEDCVGRVTGLERQAGWADTLKLNCDNTSTFPLQTQYLHIDYYCIDGNIYGIIFTIYSFSCNLISIYFNSFIDFVSEYIQIENVCTIQTTIYCLYVRS